MFCVVVGGAATTAAFSRPTAASSSVRPAPAPPSVTDPSSGAYNRGYLGYGLALDPVQNDLLSMGVKSDGEDAYNVHEIPMIDGRHCSFLGQTHGP